MYTLAEMERCATILDPGTLAVVRNALGAVPLSPHEPRIAALEAENTRLAAANADLWVMVERLSKQIEGYEAATPVVEPKVGFPARALGRQHQTIGLTVAF